ncbi:DNA-binding transcriptional regulator of glucitol operon [Jatrophihabitans sp. GAS493]|uniref:hypothetical protein n=1 Tax=Jatrophihabitans sp. GAS493 TaxID=1907575 RepID=UPI000BB67D48|nr:hypothetical protein [Jatrophihabitans sp. GAS493]SOD75086.1 DNA-binding transcriptional regulator of glucitol operon [Jatrophihabitans sp. GAS493]
MLRRCAFLLKPRWLMLYALVTVSTIAMVLLGRWQLQRAHERHGDIQNYSYVLQWWAFSTFVVFMLVRVMRDALRERSASLTAADGDDSGGAERLESSPAVVNSAEPVAYRRYVPPGRDAQELDSTQLAYNDYLASLATSSEVVKEQR